MQTLAIALDPHLIPAMTLAAGQTRRAMDEPLAEGRDEVLYLICTHRRVAFARGASNGGWHEVFAADGMVGGPFWYDSKAVPWARVRLPEGARPSVLGWAVLDPLLEDVEGLAPDADWDAGKDPDGEPGRHRHELMPWIYDRHLELGEKLEVDRGAVDGGAIQFDVEYIGKATKTALERAAGPHHKMPLILARTLSHFPHYLVYVLVCDIYAAGADPELEGGSKELMPLAEAAPALDLERDLLVALAEEALIALLGAPGNKRNTKARRFPASDAGDRLRDAGYEAIMIHLARLPERVTVSGLEADWDRHTPPTIVELLSEN